MPIRARNGYWHYRFQVNGATYQGNTGLVATERNKTAAMRVEAKARELVLAGRVHELKLEVSKFNDAAESFLKWADSEYREHPSSARRLRTSFTSLGTFFRSAPVSSITAGQVEDYKAWRRTEHKVKEITLRHDLHALSPFFAYCIKHNWARQNPLTREARMAGRGVEIPSDADAVRMHVLAPAEEVSYFTAAARWPNLHDIGRIIILQGVRPEEAMELRKSSVDLAAGTFRIEKGKSKAARRTLVLTPESRSILAAHMEGLSPWIFPSPKRAGLPITKLNGVHDRALDLLNPCRACGLGERRHPTKKCATFMEPESLIDFVLYDLRHTCATRWVQAGVDLPTVAKWLGHANLRSVHKYVHPTEAHDKAMAEKYAAYLEQLHAGQFWASSSREITGIQGTKKDIQ